MYNVNSKFLLIPPLILTTAILIFNVYMVRGCWKQYQSRGFPSVRGTTTNSRVEERSASSDPDSFSGYEPRIEYDYSVDGQKYEGDRYSYSEIGSPSYVDIAQVVDEFPVFKNIDVFYNPKDPSDSILVTGVQTADLFTFWVLTPFNIVLLWVWCVILKHRVLKPHLKPAGGVPILRTSYGVHLRLPRYEPLAIAATSAITSSIVSLVAVGFGVGVYAASISLILVVWGVVIGSSIAIYFWRRLLVGSGSKDLVIDVEQQILSLPQTHKRKTDIIVPFEKFQKIETGKRIKDKDYVYTSTIVFKDGNNSDRRELLIQWRDPRRIKALTGWINEHMKKLRRVQKQ